MDALGGVAGGGVGEPVVGGLDGEAGGAGEGFDLGGRVGPLHVGLLVHPPGHVEAEAGGVEARLGVVAAGAEVREGAGVAGVVEAVGMVERVGRRALVHDEDAAGAQHARDALEEPGDVARVEEVVEAVVEEEDDVGRRHGRERAEVGLREGDGDAGRPGLALGHAEHGRRGVGGAVAVASGPAEGLEGEGERAGAAPQLEHVARPGVVPQEEAVHVPRPRDVVHVGHHGVVALGEEGVRLRLAGVRGPWSVVIPARLPLPVARPSPPPAGAPRAWSPHRRRPARRGRRRCRGRARCGRWGAHTSR